MRYKSPSPGACNGAPTLRAPLSLALGCHHSSDCDHTAGALFSLAAKAWRLHQPLCHSVTPCLFFFYLFFNFFAPARLDSDSRSPPLRCWIVILNTHRNRAIASLSLPCCAASVSCGRRVFTICLARPLTTLVPLTARKPTRTTCTCCLPYTIKYTHTHPPTHTKHLYLHLHTSTYYFYLCRSRLEAEAAPLTTPDRRPRRRGREACRPS